jgi:hypothetical protein
MLILIDQFPYLKEMIIATSAMHLVTRRRCNSLPSGNDLIYALSAKTRAINLLRIALDEVNESNRPAILAAVVFLVNFDLIDSGRGGWKAHLQAAGTIIRSSQQNINSSTKYHQDHGKTKRGRQRPALPSPAMATLGDAVMGDILTYHIIGSTLNPPAASAAAVYGDIDVVAVLRRAQQFNYQCCPPDILHIVVKANKLFASQAGTTEDQRVDLRTITEAATLLLSQARAFDVQVWVASISGLDPDDDLNARTSLASAHRAACCLYILLLLCEATSVPTSWEILDVADSGGALSSQSLVDEIIRNISAVPEDHTLFKGSVWPTFMAGAQTDDPTQRQWCLACLCKLWRDSPWICPWGYVLTAIKMLEEVWRMRDVTVKIEDGVNGRAWNWLAWLRERSEDACLIV